MVPVPLQRTQLQPQQQQQQQFPFSIATAPVLSAQYTMGGFSSVQTITAQNPQYSAQQQFFAPSAAPHVREQPVFAVPAPPFAVPAPPFAVPAPPYSYASQASMPHVSNTLSAVCSSNRRMASAGVQTSNQFEAPNNYTLVSQIGAAAAAGQPDIPAVPTGPYMKATGDRYSFDELNPPELNPPMNSTLTNAQQQGPSALKVSATIGQVIESPHGDEPVLTGSHRRLLNLSPLQPIGNALDKFDNPTQLLTKPISFPISTPSGTLAFGGSTTRPGGIGEYMYDPQFMDVANEVTIAQQENLSRVFQQTGYPKMYAPRIAPAPSSNAIAGASDVRTAANNAPIGTRFPSLDLTFK